MKKSLLIPTILASGGGDTTPPTVTIASTQSNGTFANPIPLTFTLSEISTDFAVGDITVGAGGSIGNFAGSGTSYTADLTVTTGGATITVDVAANSFHDAAGNGNTAATQFSITSGMILYDQFTTDASAPLTSPRTCEPGPGSLVIVDTSNNLSIVGSKVVVAGGTNNWAQTGYSNNTGVARAAGKAIAVTRTQTAGNNWEPLIWRDATGLGSSFTNKSVYHVYTSPINAEYNDGAGASINPTTPLVNGTVYTFYIVLRATGAFYFANGGIYSNTLLWVANVGTQTPLYAGMGNFDGVGTLDNFKEGQLAAPFTSDAGIATNIVASPGVNEVTASEADSITEMTWQAATGQVWNLYIRWTDDTHTYCVRADQTNSTIKLIEINGGETEKASAAQTWTNGTNYRVCVIASGNTIRVVVSTSLKLNYASATYNNTATGIKTDRAGTNLITWPRTLSGSAATELNRFANP